MENKGFDFQKFIDDSKNALLNPKEHFGKLETEGGIVEPIIRALIYGAIGGLFYMLWGFFQLGAVIGPFGGAVGVSSLFISLIGAVIGAFIGGVLVLLLSAICGGNTDFEANLRVAVATMVVFPITAFVSVISGLNFWIGSLISLAINLYTLYMLYWGLSLTLKGKEHSAKVIAYVLGGLMVLLILISFIGRLTVNTLSGYGAGRLEKELEKYKNAAEEMSAKYEEELSRMESESEDIEANEATSAYEKPSKFPAKAADYAKDWFAKDGNALTVSTIDKLIDATRDVKAIDQSQSDAILKTLQTYGFKDVAEYTKAYMQTLLAFESVKSLNTMQSIMEASADEKKAAEMFVLDKAMEAAVKQTLAGGNISQADVQCAYDNWDKIVQLMEMGK